MSGGGAPKNKSLPMAVRVQDAQRVSWPAWSFRAPWWQFDKQVVDRISRAQRKILYDAMAFYQDESESLEEFFRRKSRVCTSHQWKNGLWAHELARRSLNWGEHVSRNHAKSWPGFLIHDQDTKWLMARRVIANSLNPFGGATGTRARRGRPSTRWQQGQSFCRNLLGLPEPDV